MQRVQVSAIARKTYASDSFLFACRTSTIFPDYQQHPLNETNIAASSFSENIDITGGQTWRISMVEPLPLLADENRCSDKAVVASVFLL